MLDKIKNIKKTKCYENKVIVQLRETCLFFLNLQTLDHLVFAKKSSRRNAAISAGAEKFSFQPKRDSKKFFFLSVIYSDFNNCIKPKSFTVTVDTRKVIKN